MLGANRLPPVRGLNLFSALPRTSSWAIIGSPVRGWCLGGPGCLSNRDVRCARQRNL